MSHCKRKQKDCPLYGKAVEVPFSGPKDAQTVFLGESPGPEEERNIPPQPFIGSAGKLAKKNVAMAGMDWDSLMIANSARCRVRKDDLSVKEITKILKCCRGSLEVMVKAIKPKLLILAGDFALRQVQRRSGITKARGKFAWNKEFDCWVYPVYHPAYILRNMALEGLFLQDMKTIAEFVDNGFVHVTGENSFVYKETRTIQPIIDRKLTVGIDTETTSLDWTSEDFAVISVQVSYREGAAVSVVLHEECPIEDADFTIHVPSRSNGDSVVGVRRTGDFDKKVGEVVELFESPDVKKYLMHQSFDRHAVDALCLRAGVPVPKPKNLAMDVQAAACLIEENIFKAASLDLLTQMLTDYDPSYNAMFEQKYGKADMLAVPRDEIVDYGCSDAACTRRVGVSLKEKFSERSNRKLARYLVRFTQPTLDTLYEMEKNGSLIDAEELPKVRAEVDSAMDKEAKEALKNVPKKVLDLELHVKKGLRLTRKDLVADVLFSSAGFNLKPHKLTNSKQPSVDKESRKYLLDRRLPAKARAFLTHYEEWQELHTLSSRYLAGFDKHIKSDGRIHTSFSMAMAGTGRTSTSNPNLQNTPKRSKAAKKIRKLIVAPPGWLLLALDEEQSELRWLAHLSQDPVLLHIFRSASLDIHTETAKSLCPKPWDSLSDEEKAFFRRAAKSVNFGLIYGMGVYGFIRNSKIEYDLDLSFNQANDWRNIFFAKYSRIIEYHRRAKEFCRRHKYVETLLGRRRRLPEIDSDNKKLRAEAERQAINDPIQNPSSDTVLIAANEIREKRLLDPEEARLSLFVHDELIFEVRDNSRVEDNARIVKHEMEHPPFERDYGFKLSVPLIAGAKVGKNLAEMEELSL